MRTFKRIVGVLLIFLLGVFVGSALTTAGALQKGRDLLMRGPEAVMDVVVRRLDRELKLDDVQKRKLQSIVDDARIRLRQTHARIQPEVEETLHDAEERTRAILYPNQVQKFDEILARSREKWKPLKSPSPTPAASPAPVEPPASTETPAPKTTPAPAPPTDPSEKKGDGDERKPE